jgi:manganese efflux pump family protein
MDKVKLYLEKRWGIVGWWQIAKIFMVFALTGSSSVFVGKKIMLLLGFTSETNVWLYTSIRFVLVFIVYQVLLIWIGFLFGQFHFFWNLEKRIWNRLTGKLNVNKT